MSLTTYTNYQLVFAIRLAKTGLANSESWLPQRRDEIQGYICRIEEELRRRSELPHHCTPMLPEQLSHYDS